MSAMTCSHASGTYNVTAIVLAACNAVKRCWYPQIDKEAKIVKLDEMIAQLKDQLQETKARVSDEGKYVKKEADVQVSHFKRQIMLSNATTHAPDACGHSLTFLASHYAPSSSNVKPC